MMARKHLSMGCARDISIHCPVLGAVGFTIGGLITYSVWSQRWQNLDHQLYSRNSRRGMALLLGGGGKETEKTWNLSFG
jgi:hypothetical protein